MPNRPTERRSPRLLLGGALLTAVALLVASCADALDLNDHRDAYAEACEVVDRCFGGTYERCSDRVKDVLAFEAWLGDAGTCLRGCGSVHECLDYPDMCRETLDLCNVDADCCGFSTGAAACSEGACCLKSGASCSPDDDRCCAGQGPCDPVTGTCGGVACADPGDKCLNDFQCCTGRCADPPAGSTQTTGKCDEIPCPPVGFLCESDAECCDLVCREGKCAEPQGCSLLSQTCSDEVPCCDESLLCYKPPGGDGVHGVCSPAECFPDNSDCFSDAQCCSSFCVPDFKFCGKCQGNAGDECSVAVPCCANLACVDGFCQ